MRRLQTDGVVSAGSLADAVAEADLVLMCLPGGKEVEAVAFGPGGLSGLVGKGQPVAAMSPARRDFMRGFAPAFQAREVAFAVPPLPRPRRAGFTGPSST